MGSPTRSAPCRARLVLRDPRLRDRYLDTLTPCLHELRAAIEEALKLADDTGGVKDALLELRAMFHRTTWGEDGSGFINADEPRLPHGIG